MTSKLQRYFTLSTKKSKYIAVVEACKEVQGSLLLERFVQELGLKQENFGIFSDRMSSILARIFNSKYIDTRYPWISDVLSHKDLTIITLKD